MASGHVNRTNRPNTWLHRPSLLREDSSCQPGAVHTWHLPDMLPELAHCGLCTKSYDQFVESYSNPGNEPDTTERNARISRFAMRFSSTCWYDATASL